MLARHVDDYLRSLDGGWVDWDDTTDMVVAGDPDTEITGIAVAWMPYRWTLQRTHDLGSNLLVTHEPTYFNGQHEGDRMFRFPQVREKQRWIEEAGLVIARCHDVWDRLPGIGILDAWASFLELGDPLAGGGTGAEVRAKALSIGWLT